MFTRCPECSTVFRVTANQLRVAQGDVRCGNCAHVFNAMQYLTDELPEAERRRAEAQQEQAESGPDLPEDGGDSMEFDAPEQTWSDFFIEAPSIRKDVTLDGELETITADPEEWKSMLTELGVEPMVDGPAAESEQARETGAGPTEPEAAEADSEDWDEEEDYPSPVFIVEPDPAPPFADSPAPATAATTAELPASEWLPPAAVDAPPWSEAADTTRDPLISRRTRRWAAVAALLALSLVAQWLHYSRDALAAHPRYGPWVRDFYSRFDTRLYPEWPLSAFSVRRSEALAGGSAPDALDISAALEVAGAYPVGLPLVRVTLRDQWANAVGSRLFVPEEYLAAELPNVVPPGTRIGVELSLADPGVTARGYEVDVCLQRRRAGIECQLAQRPFRQ